MPRTKAVATATMAEKPAKAKTAKAKPAKTPKAAKPSKTKPEAEEKAPKSKKPKSETTPKTKPETNGEGEKSERKKNLRKGQIRCLMVLGEAHGPMSYTAIAKVVMIASSWISIHVGSHSKETCDNYERIYKFPSLVTLGYARPKVVDVDGKKEKGYEITAAGRKVLAKIKKDSE